MDRVVSSFLRQHRNEILRSWETAVASEDRDVALVGLALRNDVPPLLDALAEWLEGGGPPERSLVAAEASKHVMQRLEHGLSLAQVFREYRILRETIIAAVLQAEADEQERTGASGNAGCIERIKGLARLNAGLDVLLSQSVVEFVTERDRRADDERGRADDELSRMRRRADEVNAFRVRFSDAVDGLTDPHAVARTACQMIRAALGAERAYWSEIDWTAREYVVGAAHDCSDAPAVEGRFPMDAWEPFTSYHLVGRPVVLDDTQRDERIPPAVRESYARVGVGADLSVPVSTGGKLRATLAVNQRLPRPWTPEEVALVQEIAGRCWAAVERARAAAALRESEQQYRIMGETLPYGVWLCNPDGGAEYVSQSFLDLLEMTHEEMREFGWTHRLPPEDVQPMLDKWLHCVRTGTPWDSEHRILGPDGKYHHVLTRGRPVRDENGEITCWVGINLDIDQRKEMEEELRQADRRKTEFLAMLSHELRNPLAPIRNSIYLLERAAPGSEQATRAREVVRRQAEHLTRLVDDLLDITRISHGKIPLERSKVDLREIVRKTTDDLHSVLRQAGINLRVDYNTVGPMWLDADPTRIAQVITNLLNNSSKFTASGGTVRVSAAARDSYAELCVIDDGIGMDPADVEHMFEPFAQADHSLARTKGGLGLGLALVKSIVELHGGTVAAHSEGLGRGAEFLVRLPLVEAAAHPGKPQRVDSGTTPQTILVIEDNVDGAQSLADILEMHGHRVHVARDGRSGIDLARDVRPDVILCDIGLPDVDGYEVARMLRRDGPLRETRLIALSGYAQPEDRQAARDAGFNAHLAKPVELDELMGTLAKDS